MSEWLRVVAPVAALLAIALIATFRGDFYRRWLVNAAVISALAMAAVFYSSGATITATFGATKEFIPPETRATLEQRLSAASWQQYDYCGTSICLAIYFAGLSFLPSWKRRRT